MVLRSAQLLLSARLSGFYFNLLPPALHRPLGLLIEVSRRLEGGMAKQEHPSRKEEASVVFGVTVHPGGWLMQSVTTKFSLNVFIGTSCTWLTPVLLFVLL